MTGVRTEQLSGHADTPGATWMVLDGTGTPAGVIERAAPNKFGAWYAGELIGAFETVEEAGEACLQLHGWEKGK